MIFKVSKINDSFIQKAYQESMEDLDKFFELNWKINTPKIMIVDKREDIDALRGKKTEDGVVGWADNRIIFLLDKDKTGEESVRKYSDEEYEALIKHEVCHLFIKIISSYAKIPIWLAEGLCIFLAGQLEFRKKPEKFSNFLEHYEKGDKSVYQQSGFFVEILIEKFGREKMISLLKNLKNIKNEDEFKKLFEETYGFSLSYKNINDLLED